MADHVPLDIRGKLLPLGIHLLRAVLAEKALPGVISLPDHLCRVGFGCRFIRKFAYFCYSCSQAKRTKINQKPTI